MAEQDCYFCDRVATITKTTEHPDQDKTVEKCVFCQARDGELGDFEFSKRTPHGMLNPLHPENEGQVPEM